MTLSELTELEEYLRIYLSMQICELNSNIITDVFIAPTDKELAELTYKRRIEEYKSSKVNELEDLTICVAFSNGDLASAKYVVENCQFPDLLPKVEDLSYMKHEE